MSEVSAKDVMELRRMSGAGMMDCKKALAESGGDMDAAKDWLRSHGLAKAAKKAGREANEGLIRIHKTDDRHGVMLLVNCETDFVARTDDFKNAVDGLAQFFSTANFPSGCLGAEATPEHIEGEILKMKYDGGTVQDTITNLIANLGENMALGRIVAERSADAEDFLQEYMHGNRVGVLVCLTTGKPETHANPKFVELAKDIAMQVAAAMPQVPQAVSRDSLDPAAVEHEKKVLTEQAMQEGKPAEIAEKMVMGRINKFFGEVCLLEQPFIKDDKQKVGEIVKAVAGEIGDTVSVARFHRFQLGD